MTLYEQLPAAVAIFLNIASELFTINGLLCTQYMFVVALGMIGAADANVRICVIRTKHKTYTRYQLSR